MNKPILFLLLTFILSACSTETPRADAYGNFEADPVLVSAEIGGKLLFLCAREGATIPAGQTVALVDTVPLHLERALVEARIGSLPQKLRDALAEIEVIEKRQANLIRERDRVARLLQDNAALPKQLDDLNGEIEVLEQQKAALRSQVETANRSILAEKGPLLAQKSVIDDKIRRARVINPIAGTVLHQMAEASEILPPGSPLYQIAPLDTLTLRFYVSALQLPDIQLGQTVEVLIDAGLEELYQGSGRISWIAAEAEFTPKTIQTREERVSLVYAVEARVPNPEGRYKIGMPAEVNFNP